MAQVDEDDFDANPGLVNAFRLAQLQTQYVLHCSQVISGVLLGGRCYRSGERVIRALRSRIPVESSLYCVP